MKLMWLTDDLDDVVYSNSPQKKPVEKFEVATEDIPEAFENHPKSESNWKLIIQWNVGYKLSVKR